MLNQNDKLDIDYIVNIVQNILNKNHSDPRKKNIRLKLDGSNKEININCPICGDGKGVKYRGHIYLNSLKYVCYNERESDSMSFINFCKHFGVDIDLNKKMEIYNYLDNNWKYTKKDDFALNNMDKLINLDDFIKHTDENSSYIYNMTPIKNGSVQWYYLTNRKIYNFENIYQGVYKITEKWHEPVIIILNKSDNKLLGIQLRNLKEEKSKRIYKFINFQEIYTMMHPNTQFDELEMISYNKLSAIFNSLNVDYEKPVYVFEGFLDSVFFPNSMALVGLDTDISIFSEENVNLKFVLDNDDAGQKKSKKLIEQNFSVFLWKKLIKDLSKGKGLKFKSYLENCKDINKLVEFYDDENIYQNFNLNNYFAIDQFDLIDM